MSKVIITSDSTSDLSPAIVEELNIQVIPLYINIGDDSYKDGVEITPKEIFEKFNKDGVLPRTSAISFYDLKVFFEKLLNEGYEIIHFSISSLFSSTHQNSINAANALDPDKITFIDSLNLSTGIGHSVMRAAELARDGLSRKEIVKEIEALIPKINTSFVIDTLTYLWKGGRCSGLSAMGANLLQLKPCIEVIEGTMKVGKKYRGSLERCLNAYVDERLTDLDKISPKRIFITHTSQDEELVQKIKEKIESKNYFEEVLVTSAGGTISCHCGPGTLGVVYIDK